MPILKRTQTHYDRFSLIYRHIIYCLLVTVGPGYIQIYRPAVTAEPKVPHLIVLHAEGAGVAFHLPRQCA